MESNSEQYWASLEDAEEFGAKLKEWIEENARAPLAQTIRDEQRNAYLQLYPINLSGQASSSRIMRDGQEGELAALRIPKASTYANAVVNIVTAQKVTWQAQAGNGDAASRAQTTLGNQTLEHYWHDKGGEAANIELVRGGVPFGERFLFYEFDPTAGEVTTPPVPAATPPDANGVPNQTAMMPAQYEGDIKFNIVDSWDVVRDSHAPSYNDCDAIALCLQRNRFDLAARLGPEVLEACADKARGVLGAVKPSASDKRHGKSDLVDCWYFFHKKTPACPGGRQAILIGDKVFALDQLRYRRIPVVRYFTGNLASTPFPFAPFWSALAAQELRDSLVSAIATNNLALGTQMLAISAGSEIEADTFGPMRTVVVPANGMEPKPMQLVQSAPESFKLLDLVDSDEKQQLGLNNTILGQPDNAGQSGVAMALLTSMAQQANSLPQAVYVDAIKQGGNIIIEIVQDFFTVEHRIRIAGKAKGYMAREASVSGEKVQGVNNVSVRVANPMSQTVAGREALFDKYMQVQKDTGIEIVKSAEDVQQLVDEGRLDSLTDPLNDQAILVEEENEALSRGEPVTALLGDDDLYHGARHKSGMTSLEARKDPRLMNNYLDHLHQHYVNYYGIAPEQDPMYRQNFMMLLGIKPPAPVAGPGGPPPMGEMPPPPEAAGGPPPPGTPGLPGMPENPLTGQKFDTETGGGVVAPPGAQ